jgi:Putative MetA-pathway of phenol degradation
MASNLTKSQTGRKSRLPNSVRRPGYFINIDLTAIKKFGKWQFGPVAYGSGDLTHPIASYQQQTQFAVGGADKAAILNMMRC